jgi:hypothetical protein
MAQSYSSGGKQFTSPIGTVIAEKIVCGQSTSTISATPLVIWGDTIDTSFYPNRVFTFSSYGVVSSGTLTGTVVLYNVGTASTVATLTFTSTTPSVQSASISLSSSYVYEVRIAVTGYSSSSDLFQLYNATITVT